MKKNINSLKLVTGSLLICFLVFLGCKKYDSAFLSPTLSYALSEFTITKGRTTQSFSMVLDGSTLPVKVKWLHIYDATGKNVDSIFSKKYPTPVWITAYDPTVDKTFAQIMAKRGVADIEPINILEANGSVIATPATVYIPAGVYSVDIQVSNKAGTRTFNKMITLNIKDGKTVETTPETGSYSLGTLLANTPTGGPVHFNGNNNPFVIETITRFADTPNIMIVKVQDKDGVLFNPKNNEIMKRPNSGLNPNPPFLQNLQDYAPDTFTATDTALVLRYPLVPFPIATLGNGFNMYYRMPTQFVTIDSTTAWTSNVAGNYYLGVTDSRYKGVYTDGRYDYSIRIPMRIQVPGAYILNIKLLNVKRK
jgi:hypothetical protein